MMLFLSLLVALICSVVSGDLITNRIINAQKWIERSQGFALTQAAYGPTVVNYSTIYHRVDFAGPFGPGDLALEYDLIVNGLEALIGYNPVLLRPQWDASSTRWISTDILRVDYVLGISTGFDTTTRKYAIVQEDFRFVEYIVFDSNSALINTGFTVQDEGANVLFTLTGATIPVETICGGFIFPACSQINPATNNSYITDTGFTSVIDCITALSEIATLPQICPYPQLDNTNACRARHALTSFFLPSYHCSHVKKVSPVCLSQCLPSCANCHADATCVATYPNFPNTQASLKPVYVCKCKNGFFGNGTSCAPVQCSNNGCPSSPGSATCVNGQCKCGASFTHQPALPLSERDLCGCPESSETHRINSELICIPKGRCIDDASRHVCREQRQNQVKCVAVNNTFNAFAACRCNYGFNGGWEYPCTCAADRRIVWSVELDGQVCLGQNECTADRPHCSSTQVCKIQSGQKIGLCGATTAKRSLISRW